MFRSLVFALVCAGAAFAESPSGIEGPEGCVPPRGPAPQEKAPETNPVIDLAAHARSVKKSAEFGVAATDPEVARVRVRVPARGTGQVPVGDVAPGDVLAFTTVSGLWSVDERSIPMVGAQGHLKEEKLHRNWGDRREVTTLPFGRLLARVGGGPWLDAGADAAVRTAVGGALELRINDNGSSLADNAGSLEVEVVVRRKGGR